MKIVFDTSVLIAAFYKPLHAPCFSKDVFDYVVHYEEGIVSADILKEFRDKCVKKLGFPLQRTLRLESIVKRKLHLVRPGRLHVKLPNVLKLRDPSDRHIVDLALAVKADLILTWDQDLLSLKQVRHIRIFSPSNFWNSLQQM